MPKAGEIAQELRKLADALDKAADTELVRPQFRFWCGHDRDEFLAAVSVLPRPLEKIYPKNPGNYEQVRVIHKTPSLLVETSVWQQAVCTLVEPAKPAVYECVPLLKPEELEAVAQ